jgi:hypothetical protein
MPESLFELKKQLREGRGVSVSATDYAAYDLMRLAGVAHAANAKLMITDGLSLDKDKVDAIIGEGKDSVSLDRSLTQQENALTEEEDEEDEDDADFDDDEETE